MLTVLLIIWILWWIVSFIKPIMVRILLIPATAMTIAPFIFIADDLTEAQLQHEMQHIEQQRLFSPLGMLLIYALNFIVNLFWAWYPAIKCEHWRIRWIREIPLSDFFVVRWWWTAYSFIIFEIDAARFWWPSTPST